MDNNQIKYGKLLTSDAKLQRNYFNELCKLLGIVVIYRPLREGKTWTNYGEIDANYFPPKAVGCIFEEYPTQRTTKKLGWNSEQQTNASIISVPYDLENLQIGSLFIIPSGLDNAKGRLFRVTKMSNIMVYPASITCELVPEYETKMDSSLKNYKHTSFNLLNEEPDVL